MTKVRADQLLVSRGFASSRARAQAAIRAGFARLDGAPITKPSQRVEEDAALEYQQPFRWASRAGVKLEAALDVAGVDPRGRTCLDVGASTGGFTDVLLARGAARVYAVDVGRDQMIERLSTHPNVVLMEGQDARTLTRAQTPVPPDLVVCDASFIGIEKVLPTPLALAAPHADLIALIKPQFESGPRRGARLPDDDARRLAEETADRLEGLAGFKRTGFAESPIAGGAGAKEYFYFARR
jgi:23S rRNA (cytidine1920-2'-O)/16S rRNA (cytidine1409-2'-O)-methyltransferase